MVLLDYVVLIAPTPINPARAEHFGTTKTKSMKSHKSMELGSTYFSLLIINMFFSERFSVPVGGSCALDIQHKLSAAATTGTNLHRHDCL